MNSEPRIAKLEALAKSAYTAKDYDKALAVSSEILAIDADNPIALRCLARVHTQRGEVDEAEPIWRRLCVIGTDKCEAAVHLARSAYGRGEWDTMAQFADFAWKEDPERIDALRLAIQARIRARDGRGLPELLPQFFQKDPERGMALVRSLSVSELAEAQAAVLVRLRALRPNDEVLADYARQCHEAWEAGLRRASANQDDETSACYLRAFLANDPNDGEVVDRLNKLSIAQLRRLRMAIKKGDRSIILEQAAAAVDFNPRLFEGWFALARHVVKDDPVRGAECLRICAELRPGDVYLRFQEGMALG